MMNILIKHIYFLSIGLLLTSGSYADAASTCEDEANNSYVTFDENGQLKRPRDYRSWIYAGGATTPKTHDPDVLFPDFQNVYIDPVSYKYWKKHGEFRDGTILVKELIYQSFITESPVGKGFFMGEYRALSATVKSECRHPDQHGGWNYFHWVNRKESKLNEYAAPLGEECATCHIENAPDGGPFYNFWSVLRDAKGFGDDAPENCDTRKGLSTTMDCTMD